MGRGREPLERLVSASGGPGTVLDLAWASKRELLGRLGP